MFDSMRTQIVYIEYRKFRGSMGCEGGVGNETCFVKRGLNASAKHIDPCQPTRNILLFVNFLYIQGLLYSPVPVIYLTKHIDPCQPARNILLFVNCLYIQELFYSPDPVIYLTKNTDSCQPAKNILLFVNFLYIQGLFYSPVP